MHSYVLLVTTRIRAITMTKLKALSAVIILSAAIAAPAFAQDAIGPGYGLELQPVTNYRSNYRVPYDQNVHRADHRSGETFHPEPLTNNERRHAEDLLLPWT
jgi:hypothetical protein